MGNTFYHNDNFVIIMVMNIIIIITITIIIIITIIVIISLLESRQN